MASAEQRLNGQIGAVGIPSGRDHHARMLTLVSVIDGRRHLGRSEVFVVPLVGEGGAWIKASRLDLKRDWESWLRGQSREPGPMRHALAAGEV